MKYGIPLTKENYLHIFERFKDDLVSEEPDIVGVSCTSGDEYVPTLRVARAVKEVLPSATVVVGGYHASSCAEEMLMESKDLDCVVVGEGEEPLRRIVQNRIDKKPILQDVPGILVFNDNNFFRTNPIYLDLNDISFVDVELVEYADAYPSVSVELSRGCPFKCNFCQGPSIPHRRIWRGKNPKQAVEEIEYLTETSGNNYFLFYDPLFGADEKWVMEICRKISQRNLDIKWFAMVRVKLKKETLDMMSKAGAYALFYGLESGSPEILTLMDKVPGAKDYTDYLKRAKRTFLDSVELGIIPVIGVIIGYPGENKKTLQDTKYYIKGVVEECEKISDTGLGIDPMFYLPLPKSQGFKLLEFYEKEFGTKIIVSKWWKQDFPFFNYFQDISVIPSRNVTLDDLERQKSFLSNMSRYTEKSYRRSFWCYCNAPEIQSLRRRMQHAQNYELRQFTKIALTEWKNLRAQPHKVSIAKRLRRTVSKVVSEMRAR